MNIWQVESDYRARLEPLIGGIQTYGTFDDIDWTLPAAPRVAVQIIYDGPDVADEVRASAALVRQRFNVHVWLKLHGATDTDKAASANALIQAMNAAVGWEVSTGRFASMAPGQRTGFDGTVLRLSFAFSVPVPVTALS